MRIRYLLPIAALGTGIVALLYRRARRPRREPSMFDIDPKDPVQSLDGAIVLEIEELEVDAIPHDLDALDDQLSPDLQEALTSVLSEDADLYGVYMPVADPRRHPDEDPPDGENWVEALLEESIELGPTSEILVFDESDLTSPIDTRDQPTADRGSGGPRGL